MKKILLTLSAALLLSASIFAQAPEKMSYQAVVRDANSSLISNQTVGMQISILQGSVSGDATYVETQIPETNANGLISLEIGSGAVLLGDFSTIDWSDGPYFIKTETDPEGGTNYSISGVSQLMSVPYAIHAKTAETITGGIMESDPEFMSWDKSSGIMISESQISDLTHIVDTDTQLSESQVDGFVANNGYLTSEVDGSVTNEIELPTGGVNGQVLKTDGSGNYAWIAQTVDTKLSEAQVDGFVANNGYLTSEVDGSVTNEIEMPTNASAGDMSYYNGSSWTVIAAPSNGMVLTFCEGAPTWTASGTCPILVGSQTEGGIVYKIFQEGDAGYVAGEIHGMVASPTLGFAPLGVSLGLINDLNTGAYSNWAMPNYAQLAEVHLAVGGNNYFSSYFHWSSTNSASGANWIRNPENGNELSLGWGANANALAVREF